LDHVKFVKNKVEKGALRVDRSVVSISNGVFYENNDDEAGTDLYIVDNRTLAQDGSYVTCVGKNNIFLMVWVIGIFSIPPPLSIQIVRPPVSLGNLVRVSVSPFNLEQQQSHHPPHLMLFV
jgi:hypothetical protein